MRFFSRTPIRTFVLIPLIAGLWEFMLNGRVLELYPLYTPLMLWGYLQYRLCGRYRRQHGGGGPGLEPPPEDLVTSGPYA